MISTKYIIDIKDIPDSWIFENYCGLSEKLTGQDIRINSVFGTEKTPSMFIFNSEGKYYYKDFSSGNGGNSIDLVSKLNNLSFADTVSKLLEDYKSYLENGGINKKPKTFVKKAKSKIKELLIRDWEKRDANFWLKYNISSFLLEKYNVKPINVILEKNGYDINLTGKTIYGYFNSSNELCRIYQPYNKDYKFLLLKENYIEGFEQLEFKKKKLMILSSLKDGLSFSSFNLDYEFIAPSSENSMISPETINYLKTKYDEIIVMFDNDNSGITSMLKYNSLYDFPYIILDLSKDLSDSIKDYGAEYTKQELIKLLNNL